jgi:ubiquinone/menaquinone biosynthesis C-methylase UbiE
MSEAGIMFSDGRAYERMMGRWSRLAGASFIDWLGAPKGLGWLDVGCGNGAFTEELIARAAPKSVAGIDPSEGQIAYAREREGTRMASFRVAGAQDLPFEDRSFDAAIMALVIAFVPDPAKAVREMARVVRRGGLVATYMWDVMNRGVPLYPLNDALKSIGLERPMPPSSEASRTEAMQGLWKDAGLEAIESREIAIQVSFTDFDDYWASNVVPIGPQGALIAAMSPSQFEALRKALREILPIDSKGRITYEARANAIKGKVA